MSRTFFGLAVIATMLAAGCGGGQKGPATAEGMGAGEEEESGNGGGEMIPAEKFDEIERVFSQKTPVVSRCHGEGVDSGEINSTQKGVVTVGLTITPQGRASDVKIRESTFHSKTIEACIVRHVSEWEFPTIPKSLDYSHSYKLEQF